MVFKPTKVYTDKSKKQRIYSEMWTGRWWEFLQKRIKKGGTVCPVIIATDKTQLTQFIGGKAAYPVYLTIGNIPRGIRRKPSASACVLIAYLSVEKVRELPGTTEIEQRSKVQRVFHEAMRTVLHPLIAAGHQGVEMVSCDGTVRRVFPLLTCYVADYPEQCLVACCKYGTCPKCTVSAKDLQDRKEYPLRTQKATECVMQDARQRVKDEPDQRKRNREYYNFCMDQDVAGGVWKPFWVDFPHCDIHEAMTPDVLHQLYQGVLKHLIQWCMKACGQRLDRRIQVLPPTHGVRQFKHGFSNLSQISGTERKNMAKILLGCVVGYMSHEGIKAVTALLDFIYLAQYEAHTAETFQYMEDALRRFYDNRNFFITIGARTHFNIPKFHSLTHYIRSIKMFGATDNYNTEMFERLHIDFAKMGWRASNKRDEFPQMIRWLGRQEKVTSYEVYQAHYGKAGGTERATSPSPSSLDSESDEQTDSGSQLSEPLAKDRTTFIPVLNSSACILPTQPHSSQISISKHPAYPNTKLPVVEKLHGTQNFIHCLKIFINRYLPRNQQLSERRLGEFRLPFTKVDVYNLFRFHPSPINDSETGIDVVRAMRKSSQYPHGRFDTVIAIIGDEAESTGLQGNIARFHWIIISLTGHSMLGTRVGRIRVIFRLPRVMDTTSGPRDLPKNWENGPLAFVEWFSPTPAAASAGQGLMYKISQRQGVQGRLPGAIIPLGNIRQSCMLMPAFTYGGEPEAHHRSEQILDQVDTFFVNNWRDKYSYQTIY
ncbi:hypothetical protein CVT24_000245 [Panaeolus cyanescens]|uniref:Uncharacterized protein n=1 Tax=Panaeolus cyanescens TaxID=181874 RepID=A0A409X2F4_9AGAR|nr:hypothetical protein CVT24_000245 [Panaeolus cyanescens]